MGVLGQMFPTPKISDESGESGTGEPENRLGPIDLVNGIVTIHRTAAQQAPEQDEPEAPQG
jgi:hypothetical protein